MKSKKLKLILTVCIGLTLTTIAVAGVYALNTPSAPRALWISDFKQTECTVVFSPPESDGGSPLTGYVIEVKDGRWGLSWNYYAHLPASVTECPIRDREEGAVVKIRVYAENVFGRSEPAKIVVELPKVH